MTFLGRTIGLVLLAGCIGSPDASLLPPQEEPDERLHRLLNMKVRVHFGEPGSDELGEYEATQLNQLLHGRCTTELTTAGICPGTLCQAALCEAMREICQAHYLLEMTSISATPFELTDPVEGDFWIPAQSSSTNAALATEALITIDGALEHADLALRSAGSLTPNQTNCTNNPADVSGAAPNQTGKYIGIVRGGRTLARAFAASYLEAYEIYRDAVEVANESDLAVADAFMSTNPSLDRGIERGILGADETGPGALPSRLRVARRMVGANALIAPLCTGSDLTPPARAALSVLREAAVAPSDVLDPMLSVAELVADDLDEGSVVQRLHAKWGAVVLNPATTTAEDLYEYFNLEESHFAEARAYLAQEYYAFARSLFAKGPPIVGELETYDTYVATAEAPRNQSPIVYAGYARWGYPNYAEAGVDHTAEFLSGTLPIWNQQNGFAWMADAVMTRAASVYASTIPAPLVPEVKDPLALLLTEAETVRPGRLTFSGYNPGSLAYADGFGTADDVRLVIGEGGRRCAVEGSDEGEDCDMATRTFLALSNTVSPLAGFSRAVMGSTASVPPATSALYLVRRKPGAAVGRPGAYEVLTALRWTGTTPGWRYVPIVPEAERTAGRALAPSPEWCTQSHVTCAGETFNERIALEDELSLGGTSGDSIEDSWRHALELARQASLESDLLGEEVVRLGLEQDLRAEQAVEELLQLCGADVEPFGLIDEDLTGLSSATPCTSNPETDCNPLGEDFRCHAGRCAVDPLAVAQRDDATPEMRRLAECLSEDNVLDFVALGNRPLCVWRSGDSPYEVCVDADPETNPCPALATLAGPSDPPMLVEEGYSCASVEVPSGSTLIPMADIKRLGLFDASDPGRGDSRAAPCAALRRLRNTAISPEGHSAALEEVVASNYFHPSLLTPIASRIGWEPRLGGYSAITVDGGERWRTGDTWTVSGVAEDGWPCETALGEMCEAMEVEHREVGLFCDVYDCDSASQRAAVNDRMARAAIVAAAIAGYSPGRILIPDASLLHPSASSRATVVGRLWPTADAVVDVYTSEHGGVVFDDGATVLDFAWVSLDSERGLGTTWYYVSDTGGKFGFGPLGTTVSSLYDPFVAAESLHGSLLRGLSQYGGPTIRIPTAHDPGWYRRWFDGGVGAGPTPELFVANANLASSYLPPWGGHPETFLDGLELMCQVGENAQAACDLTDPPSVTRPEHLESAKRYLECVAASIRQRSAASVLANFPEQALDPLRRESGIGSYPAVGGGYGAAVSRLRGALTELSEVNPQIAAQLEGFGSDLRQLRFELAASSARDEIEEIRFMSSVSDRIALCASSGSPWGAAAQCANAVAQIAFADMLRRREETLTDISREVAISRLQDSFMTRTLTLSGLGTRASSAAEQLDAALAELETMRRVGRRALNKALFMDSSVAGSQFAVDTVMRRRLNTARVRYEEARRDAVRMAFLAKRAVEQRIGMRLRDMRDDLPLVAAPATWESTLCASVGVDYERLRDATTGAENFADAYVGDYVDKLEGVVESYRLVYPFHEGQDTAVFSLRDEVHNVRDLCESPGRNLLYYAGALGRRSAEAGVGWQIENCPTDAGGEFLPNCIAAIRLEGTAMGDEASPFCEVDDPVSSCVFNPEFQNVGGYRVVFGALNALGSTCSAPDCNLQSDSELFQEVALAAGRYRLSWYGRPDSFLTVDPATAVTITAPAGLSQSSPHDEAAANGWTRYSRLFDLAAPVTVRIAVPNPDLGESARVDLAAFLLEEAAAAEAPMGEPTSSPSVFVDTTDTLTSVLPMCEDTDGDKFRGPTFWERACVPLCPDGFRDECAGVSANIHCYRETTFNVHQREIDRGRLFTSGGFARGNYNYRIEEIALNVVGSASRTCADESLPSTCYSAGFIPFSLYHDGPYYVRNHRGEDYQAHLFAGRVEHARALAFERYLSNPIGSADQGFIGPYMRAELRGRPLDGTFRIRIWEEPGVNFEGIEDIQVVLKYRYWTRFE